VAVAGLLGVFGRERYPSKTEDEIGEGARKDGM
jgi:hypothetical protein